MNEGGIECPWCQTFIEITPAMIKGKKSIRVNCSVCEYNATMTVSPLPKKGKIKI